MTRLSHEVFKGQTEIHVDLGLDLVPGDRIALAPTSYNHTTGEDLFVKSYDNTTGLIVLETPLQYYHWGAP
jgi:hypothetical protein